MDWWGESNVNGYDFDINDESSEGQSRLSQKLNKGLSEMPSPFDTSGIDTSTIFYSKEQPIVKPELNKLFSEKSLISIFDADNLVDSMYDSGEDNVYTPGNKQIPDIDRTIRDAFIGRPHSFEPFKSFSSKQELLKSAEKLGDGNVLLEVVIFLSKTLKEALFHRLLRSSALASQHYISFLSTKNTDELENILTMLGRSQDAAINQFDTLVSSNHYRLDKLRNCSKNHFETSKDKLIVSNHINLLVWQEANIKRLMGESVASTLSVLCSDHWHEVKDSKLYPQTFSHTHGVSNKLFDWIAFMSRAKQGCWLDISNYFIVKGWLGSPKLKTDIPVDHIINRLHKLSAPIDVIQLYIQFLDSPDKRAEAEKKIQQKRN